MIHRPLLITTVIFVQIVVTLILVGLLSQESTILKRFGAIYASRVTVFKEKGMCSGIFSTLQRLTSSG